ncbi:MAG: hypothetical protein JW751_28215 [Polyangiaceae bacterium]|nr:hypothetical protein [Polyangiaceae bacterium]
MNQWAKSKRRVNGPKRIGATAHLIQPVISIRAMQFANPAAGTNYCVLYQKSNTLPLPPPIAPAPAGSHFQGWGQTDVIDVPEWEGKELHRAAVYRNRPVSVRVKLVVDSPSTSEINGTLLSSPALDGDPTLVTGVNTPFTLPAGATEVWVRVDFGGTMPDEIGRYVFNVVWGATGSGFTFGDQVTKLRIYSVYDDPLRPDYDSPSDGDTGSSARVPRDTVSGTDQRIDRLMRLVGGPNRRHVTATTADVIGAIWNLHVGINDASPPYFDGGHDEHISNNGRSSGGTEYPLAQQWLMWASPKPNPAPTGPKDRYWNDGSCIGHVQLLKTMAASVGMFTRRTWVFPHTHQLPGGATRTFVDTDLYCLGNYDTSKKQYWTFPRVDPAGTSPTLTAVLVLMEPGATWENFEACLRSQPLPGTYRFLPGGYGVFVGSPRISSAPGVTANKGFSSAAQLLRWWCNTHRPGFGKRFQCWVGVETVAGPGGTSTVRRFWDVTGSPFVSPGVPYDDTNYTKIRDNGKEAPPPP